MQLLSIFTALFALLAGRVLALDIAINAGGLSTIPASQLLDVSDSALQAACNTNCTTATNAINACQDDSCVCSDVTATLILDCEQCMFSTLIAENRPMPEVRAGNQVVLTDYASACLNASVNLHANFTTLVVPDNWDGPFDQILNPATTAITLIAALLVGGGAIAVVNTM